MYALKARDKLHKLEKEEDEERRAPRKSKASDGASARGRRRKSKDEERLTTAQREAKVIWLLFVYSGTGQRIDVSS